MLQSIGVQWSLAGHSERRTLFGESDEYINRQCKLLIEQGMSVMLCIGETLEEFEKNLVGPVCEIQLKKCLAGISEQEMARVAIAYEPVWAIGTGKVRLFIWFVIDGIADSDFLISSHYNDLMQVATPEIAQEVHSICRNVLREMYGDDVADSTRILYGGSVTPESVDGLMAQPDIDGALVGGASLDADKFGRIINFVPSQVEQVRYNLLRRFLSKLVLRKRQSNL